MGEELLISCFEVKIKGKYHSNNLSQPNLQFGLLGHSVHAKETSIFVARVEGGEGVGQFVLRNSLGRWGRQQLQFRRIFKHSIDPIPRRD